MIRDLTLADALVVVNDMRPQDAACVRAVAGQEPGEWFAVDRWRTNGPGWTLLQDGEPWLIAGVSMQCAWVGVFWMVARPDMRGESWRKLIRRTRTVMGNALDPANEVALSRLEAHVLDGWTEAAEFAQRVGFEYEGTRRQAGANGESVQTWARLGPKGMR